MVVRIRGQGCTLPKCHEGASRGMPHHDLGWQEALSFTGHGLQAFLCVPVQVLTSLIQGAV